MIAMLSLWIKRRSVSVVGLDSYGNGVLLDPEQWCLKAHGSGLHQSVCYLEWQPLVAGNRSISISIDGIEVGNGPLQVTVQPGPLVSVKPVSHMPSADNQIVCYPTQQLKVCFKGFDEFENTVPIDSMQWYMESLDILGKVQLPDSFAVKVVSAPLDPTNCRVSLDKPIFATTHSKLTVQVALLDCMSKPYCYTKLERSLIKMKVNDNTECSVEIEYNGQLVGCPICEDVVYIHPYRKGEYLYADSSLPLACKKIPRWKLTGDDGVNVDNINRVLDTTFPELNERIDYNDIQRDDQDSVVRFHLLKFEDGVAVLSKTFELVSLLVESIHYRDQANKFNESREEWKAKAMDAYNSTMHDETRECRACKEKYGELMDECHRKSSDAIFHFYNYGRSDSEIDLHGQLVANEDELRAYGNRLLRKKDKTEVERIIEKERNEMDEAIRRLGNINVGETRESRGWLEIIVGAGHHSRDQRQKVRPKVEQFLNERNIPFIESNKGALLITYREYNGREPCYATFYFAK
ncbi:hypothetical protein QZH41_000573 [Actinostola sp. cb2023]|nr:hypothetical protein QZH41_000573 [Actinostola sp. cb2023]